MDFKNKLKPQNPQVILTLHRDRKALHIQGSGWKMGEEKDFLFVIDEAIKYFKSDRYRNTIINNIFKKK